ncbi:MAG: hypothetical protein WDO73_33140 [Ignavibacteriota bacterium]
MSGGNARIATVASIATLARSASVGNPRMVPIFSEMAATGFRPAWARLPGAGFGTSGWGGNRVAASVGSRPARVYFTEALASDGFARNSWTTASMNLCASPG